MSTGKSFQNLAALEKNYSLTQDRVLVLCIWAVIQSVLPKSVKDQTLVEIAGTFYMLHGNLQAIFLQNMETSGSLHGNIL